VVKVIWRQAASPPHMDSSVVFVRWCHSLYSLQCIRCGSRFPHVKEQFWAQKGSSPGHVHQPIYSKQLSMCQHQYNADADWVVVDGGAHWRNLVHKIEPSMCGDNVALVKLLWPLVNTTHTQPFYGRFSGITRVSRYQKRTSGLCVQGKINRGRHIDHPAARHSIGTNQFPPPPSPIFYRPDALPAAQPTVSKHWRQSLVKYYYNIIVTLVKYYYSVSQKKGCHPIYGYNFVNSWSICKILSLL